MAAAKPVILCGRDPRIATGVKKLLESDYEGLSFSHHPFPLSSFSQLMPPVIHIILTSSAGASEIPPILQGRAPPSSSEENLGSRNYSKLPVAVITGGGYDDVMFKEMYDAARGKGKHVLWLRPDITVQGAPPLGPAYAIYIVGRVKACLGKLEEEGRLDDAKGDEVVLY